jgi:hypothetical protein
MNNFEQQIIKYSNYSSQTNVDDKTWLLNNNYLANIYSIYFVRISDYTLLY